MQCHYFIYIYFMCNITSSFALQSLVWSMWSRSLYECSAYTYICAHYYLSLTCLYIFTSSVLLSRSRQPCYYLKHVTLALCCCFIYVHLYYSALLFLSLQDDATSSWRLLFSFFILWQYVLISIAQDLSSVYAISLPCYALLFFFRFLSPRCLFAIYFAVLCVSSLY